MDTPEQRRDSALAVIVHWSNFSSLTARRVMEDHGPPDRIASGSVEWDARGPWTRIVVRDEPPYYDSRLGPDNLEHTVAYPVPEERLERLAAFSGKVRVSKDRGSLTSLAVSEELNVLALNLAHEVIIGAKNPAEARDYYERVLLLSTSGKSSPYMQGLIFRK